MKRIKFLVIDLFFMFFFFWGTLMLTKKGSYVFGLSVFANYLMMAVIIFFVPAIIAEAMSGSSNVQAPKNLIFSVTSTIIVQGWFPALVSTDFVTLGIAARLRTAALPFILAAVLMMISSEWTADVVSGRITFFLADLVSTYITFLLVFVFAMHSQIPILSYSFLQQVISLIMCFMIPATIWESKAGGNSSELLKDFIVFSIASIIILQLEPRLFSAAYPLGGITPLIVRMWKLFLPVLVTVGISSVSWTELSSKLAK